MRMQPTSVHWSERAALTFIIALLSAILIKTNYAVEEVELFLVVFEVKRGSSEVRTVLYGQHAHLM